MGMMAQAMAMVLALVLAAPAAAGMRATYAGGGDPRPLLVEVADNGDFRVDPPDLEGHFVGIGGTLYMVRTRADAAAEVVRIADLAAALAEVISPAFRTLFEAAAAGAADGPVPKAVRTSSRTVAGIPGEVWQVTAGDPPQTRELVFTRAPELAPLGTAIARFMEANVLLLAPLVGAAAAEMGQEMRAVLAIGTPLDGLMRLERLEEAEIDPERLRLPAEPLGRAAIIEEMRRQRAGQPGN